MAEWDITAAPAQNSTTSEKGTYGGVMAAVRKHLCSQTISGDHDAAGWTRSEVRDLAGRTVHLRGVDVIVLGGYARDGDWRSQVFAVATITRNGSLAFIWHADFNEGPTALSRNPGVIG